MPKYRVRLTETVIYEIDIDAPDEDEAEADAKEFWANTLAEDMEDGGFDVQGEGVELNSVEEITK